MFKQSINQFWVFSDCLGHLILGGRDLNSRPSRLNKVPNTLSNICLLQKSYRSYKSSSFHCFGNFHSCFEQFLFIFNKPIQVHLIDELQQYKEPFLNGNAGEQDKIKTEIQKNFLMAQVYFQTLNVVSIEQIPQLDVRLFLRNINLEFLLEID